MSEGFQSNEITYRHIHGNFYHVTGDGEALLKHYPQHFRAITSDMWWISPDWFSKHAGIYQVLRKAD